jgi:hypothetical protein
MKNKDDSRMYPISVKHPNWFLKIHHLLDRQKEYFEDKYDKNYKKNQVFLTEKKKYFTSLSQN